MLIKIGHVSDSNFWGFQHVKSHQRSQTLLHNPPKNMAIFNPKEKHGFQTLGIFTRLQKYGNNKRKFIVCSVEPGASPSGPPQNILSWIVAVAIAVVIPFVNYKWGPSIKRKVEAVMQRTEDVVEVVEKVAEEVEKAAEDIADNLPKGGKLREAVDFVEKLAERTAKDAGAIDDFIDKVQEEEEKAESFVESLKDESKTPPKNSNEEKPNDQN